MSLLWCKPRSAIEITEQGPKVTGKRTYLAKVTERTDGRAVIAASPDLPAQFSYYDGMLCVGRTFKRIGKGWRHWEIELNYDTDVPQSQLDAINNPNPLLRPCLIDVVTFREQVAVTKDRNGNPLQNVLYRPYDPPLMKWRTRLRFECEKNVPNYPDWYFNLADKINNAPFNIRGQVFDEKTLIFTTDRIPDKVNEGNVQFFKARFAIEWNRDTWDPEILQADVYYFDTASITNKRITEDGDPVTTPRKLDITGEVITSDDPDDAYYKKEEIQELANYSVLTTVLA